MIRPHVVVMSQLLVAFVAMVVSSISAEGSLPLSPLTSSSLSSKDCPSYGCPLLPRDIAFDDKARKALQKIRRLHFQQDNDDKDTDNKSSDEGELKGACHELVSSGNVNQVTLTLVGYKGGRIQDQVNQDRALLLSPYRPLQGKPFKIPHMQILGVFDGHGATGEVVSDYTVHHLPQRLAAKLDKVLTESVWMGSKDVVDDLIKTALVETFLEIDQSIPTGHTGGCTASVVLQVGTKVYVANAGDSISVIATHVAKTATTTTDDSNEIQTDNTNDGVNIVYVTREDKPHLPDERERIEKMGGTVHIPDDPREDTPRVMYTDPVTGYQSGLAMSRSIGDWEMIGRIAEPIVAVLDLEKIVADARMNNSCPDNDASDETCIMATSSEDVSIYAISATDGLMDFMRPFELAHAFATAFYRENGPHPFIMAEDLILEAAKGWHTDMGGRYRDDIAVVASKLSIYEEPQQ